MLCCFCGCVSVFFRFFRFFRVLIFVFVFMCCFFSHYIQVLAQRTYDAQLAGLGWKVGPHPCGFVVQVSGFSQKIDPLLQQVCAVVQCTVVCTVGLCVR